MSREVDFSDFENFGVSEMERRVTLDKHAFSSSFLSGFLVIVVVVVARAARDSANSRPSIASA